MLSLIKMESPNKKQKLEVVVDDNSISSGRDYSEYFKKIKEDGYVVIPNVLSIEDQLKCVNGYYDYAENLGTGIKRNDPKTMTSSSLPPSIAGGIDCNIAVAHKQFVWDVRLNTNVIDVFSQMYGTDKLLSSFDRICFMKGTKGRTNNIGLHTDQNPKKVGLNCIQGLVTLTHKVSSDSEITMLDTEHDDGTLFVLKKTHVYHSKFFSENKVEFGKNGKDDWYKFNEIERSKLLNEFENVRVTGSPGSLFLWDSRTFHAPVTPLKDLDRRRLCIYTCMAPARWATDSQIKKKKKAFDEYRSTSHWPLHSLLFQKPRTYGNDEKDLSHYPVKQDRVVTENMLLISGSKQYGKTGLLGWSSTKNNTVLNFQYIK